MTVSPCWSSPVVHEALQSNDCSTTLTVVWDPFSDHCSSPFSLAVGGDEEASSKNVA